MSASLSQFDTNKFFVEYSKKNLASYFHQANVSLNFDDSELPIFISFLDSNYKDVKLRMMTACRVAKKRFYDNLAGNDTVQITLSKQAHQELKTFADSKNFTLSQAVINVFSFSVFAEKEPEQTFAFSYDDLQEQSRLIEQLQFKVRHLEFENELLKKSELECNLVTNDLKKLQSDVDYWQQEELKQSSRADDAESQVSNLKSILKDFLSRHITNRKSDKSLCQHLTSKGSLCKNKASHIIELCNFSISLCDGHYNEKTKK